MPVALGTVSDPLSSNPESVRGDILSISVKLSQEATRPQTLNCKLFNFPALINYPETPSSKSSPGYRQRGCPWMLLFRRKAVLLSVASLVYSLPVSASTPAAAAGKDVTCVCTRQIRAGLQSDIIGGSLAPCGEPQRGLAEF